MSASSRVLLALALTAPVAAHAAAERGVGTGDGALPATVTDSLGIRFVFVPAGEFMMGSDELPDDLARSYPQYPRERLLNIDDEAPVHRVRISRPFYLAQHEVTVGQFQRFLQASGYVPESVADGTGAYGYNPHHDPATSARGDAFEGRSTRYSWRAPGFAQGDDHPVVNVTWNDAVAMARWLSAVQHVIYRLPTEAEWEYACRAGTRTRYHNGNDPRQLVRVGNVFDADTSRLWPQWEAFALADHDGFEFTAPVGSFASNAWGLHDMHGNVWEWVADRYARDYYAQSPLVDPQGPADGSMRVRRGGSWTSWALYARCAYRNWNTPQSRYTLLGMRLVREVGTKTR